jgi:predicted DsbA family dithiol-disulfide isomerase
MIIEVYSDVICPWCYIGRRRLEKALEQVGGAEVSVRWQPYELNPDMPAGGISRRDYRTRKFGSWERSQELDARVAAAAAAEGLSIAFDRMERTPNTFDAHRLLWLVGEKGPPGAQDALAGALFHAYFVEGEDVGSAEVLTRLAVGCGMALPAVSTLLNSDKGAAEVRAAEEQARTLGIDSVPTFVLDGRYVVTGAQPVPLLAEAICRASEPGATRE